MSANLTNRNDRVNSDSNLCSIGGAVIIDERQIQGHLDELVRGTVEETINKLLDAEADLLFIAVRLSEKFQKKNRIALPSCTILYRYGAIALGPSVPKTHVAFQALFEHLETAGKQGFPEIAFARRKPRFGEKWVQFREVYPLSDSRLALG